MLPPGHIAAGFLTAKALLKISHTQFPPSQTAQLLWWGAFFAFAPDLDSFVAFAKIKSFWFKQGSESVNHRKFYSHIPILWLLAGLLVYFFAATPYYKFVGLLLWLGSWAHFLLDSLDMPGIMWLWPFNKELWALKNRGVLPIIKGKNFFDYWINFIKFYIGSWTFYAEIIILITAIISYIK